MIPSARRVRRACPGEWRSLVAHPAGGRAVAGSNPVSPIRRKVLLNRVRRHLASLETTRGGSKRGPNLPPRGGVVLGEAACHSPLATLYRRGRLSDYTRRLRPSDAKAPLPARRLRSLRTPPWLAWLAGERARLSRTAPLGLLRRRQRASGALLQ